MMRLLGVATTTVSILLAGCNSISSIKPGQVRQDIDAEMQRATENRSRETAPDAVSRALVPPLTGQIDAPAGKISESRFDLSVSNAPASQVFMAIVSGTRYSMLVNPGGDRQHFRQPEGRDGDGGARYHPRVVWLRIPGAGHAHLRAAADHAVEGVHR
ncbi:MAG: hypothetical protein M5R42_02420 [Rhodocyclaceae bacterium]|nr:hypothetical protein [Rhodocyclaceae bacterium]